MIGNRFDPVVLVYGEHGQDFSHFLVLEEFLRRTAHQVSGARVRDEHTARSTGARSW
jgi:hypothetical protein